MIDAEQSAGHELKQLLVSCLACDFDFVLIIKPDRSGYLEFELQAVTHREMTINELGPIHFRNVFGLFPQAFLVDYENGRGRFWIEQIPLPRFLSLLNIYMKRRRGRRIAHDSLLDSIRVTLYSDGTGVLELQGRPAPHYVYRNALHRRLTILLGTGTSDICFTSVEELLLLLIV